MSRKTRTRQETQKGRRLAAVPVPRRANRFHFDQKWIAFEEFAGNTPWLIVAVWAVLFLPHPFVLGVYHDDWWTLMKVSSETAPFSWARLTALAANDPPRPVITGSLYVITSVSGTTPFLYQTCSMLLVLAAALSLRRWLGTLFEERGWLLIVNLAACFWLSAPWIVGVTAWPLQTFNSLIAQILFTEAMGLMSHAMTQPRPARLTWFAILLVASFLTYEAFYFQQFLALALTLVWARVRSVRSTIWIAGICVLVQVAVVAWNRGISLLLMAPGQAKQLNPGWVEMARRNVAELPGLIEGSFAEHRRLCHLAILAVALSAFCWVMIASVSKTALRLRVRILLTIAIGVASIIVSALVYALAGYGFASVGVMSRTLITTSTALTVIVLAACAASLLTGYWTARAANAAIMGFVIAALAMAQRSRVDEWRGSWQLQQEIVRAIPETDIERLADHSALLYVGPSMYNDHVVVFAAPWDITGAVMTRMRQDHRRYPPGVTVYSAVDARWSWDGSTLTGTLPGSWVQTFAVRRLSVWDYARGVVYPVQPGFHRPR
jgi:hypothetical protein